MEEDRCFEATGQRWAFRATCFQSWHSLSTTHSSRPTRLPPSMPPNWLSALHKSYFYTWQGASCLLGDGQLLKARILIIFIFLFPECLAQRRALYSEFKRHTFRRGLARGRASCLQIGVCTYTVDPVPNTVIKGQQPGRCDRLSIISDLSTFLHHSHLVHRNFGGFILADGIYYKCELEEKIWNFTLLVYFCKSSILRKNECSVLRQQ